MYVIALLQDPHQDPQLHAGMGTTLGIVRICTHLYVQQRMCKTLLYMYLEYHNHLLSKLAYNLQLVNRNI